MVSVFVESTITSGLRQVGWASDGSTEGQETIQSAGNHEVNYPGEVGRCREESLTSSFLFPDEALRPTHSWRPGVSSASSGGCGCVKVVAPVWQGLCYRRDAEWRGTEEARVSE